MNFVGLVPAAGRATRLPPLPCSKEIFPIGYVKKEDQGRAEYSPRPIISYLLEQFIQAGVKKCIVITHKDKPDIARYLGDGASFGIHISYLIQEKMCGMPFALDLAYPWIKEATVMFGMPDTIFTPAYVFDHLLNRLSSAAADLTLGLFPTDKPHKFGMVDFQPDTGQFISTVDKPDVTSLRYMWGTACWRPNFTRYMHEFLQTYTGEKELVFSTVLQNAHRDGLKLSVLTFEDGEFIDIGTPDDLLTAMIKFGKLEAH